MPYRMPDPEHPDEGMPIDVEPPKQPATISDSRKRLEEVASERGKPFSFHEDAETESLVDLFKDWDEVCDAPNSGRLKKLLKLREQARKLGGDATHFELKWYDDGLVVRVTDRQWPQYVLRVLVQMVAETWREHGGKGTGSYYSDPKGQHDGPLIRLLLELFEQAGIPEKRRPGRHSLHQAIQAVAQNFPPVA
jgi:hypothetical protein